MRVIHVEAGRHLYGGARQVGHLIGGLSRRGVENVLACPAGQPLATLLPAAGVGVRVVELPMSGDVDPRMRARLAELISGLAPAIVHVHSRRGADRVGGLASRAAGCPAILTRRVDSREPAFWLRRKCRPYARIVAISSAIRDDLLRRVGLPAGQLELIPSAVHNEVFSPDPAARARLIERFGLPGDARLVGVAAQLIPRKGHAFLLECLTVLAERHRNLRVLLFGRGPLEASIRRRIGALGLDGTVMLCGFEPALERVLPGLDLLAHPAEREGLGSVVLEAMSAGLPVAAAAVGGIVDAIDDRSDGLLVPARDRAGWIDALDALLSDPGLRQRLGSAARAKVVGDFTIDAMTDAYLDLYARLGAGRRAA